MNIAPMCSNVPLFEKYIIDKQYNIKKLQRDGTEIEITDPIERHKILDSNYLKGSIGITRDTNHLGSLHPLFYAGHIFHSFFYRHKNIDVNLCHGLVILKHDKPKKGEEPSHPFVYAHAVLDGIHTTKWDDLKDDKVTEVVYYRPLSKSLRKAIVSATYQTAYISKKEFRKKQSPSLQPPFSIFNMILSLFHNDRSQAGNVMGPFPSEKSMRSTAYLIADLMLGHQFLDENQQPKAFYCIPYTLGVLQGGLVHEDLNKISAALKDDFIKNAAGKLLPRKELADKIFQSFRYKNNKDPVACQLWNTYWGHKLLRLHTDYLMAAYLGKKLDKLSQNGENITASYHIVKFKFPQEKSWLDRCIREYKHKLDLPPLVKKIISVTAKVLMVILSLGLLLPLVFYMEDLSHKIDLEDAAEKFHARMAEQLSKDPSLRPNLGRIELTSDTCAFNHVFEFTIHQGVIWQRRRDPINNLWEPLFFDGELTGAKPVSLSADGANLVVVDDKGAIHYRKMLSEGRGFKDIHRSPSLRRHLKEHPEIQIHKKDTHSYFAVDKIDKPYWYTSWYNFPGLKRIVNAITGSQLFAKGLISHLGKFSLGYADANGKFHINPVGNTTFYEKMSKGTSVRKYDPWVPIWSRVEIPFPRSSLTCFIAKIIDASASTVMALGYEWNKITGEGCLKILIKLCDIDIKGDNPCLDYAFQAEKSTHPEVRVLPDRVENEGWIEYPLPKDIQVAYAQISIVQTGPGNDAYELRVPVKTFDGREGYYRKPDLQADTPWEFVPYEAIDKSVVLAVTKKIHSHEIVDMPFTPVYKGQTEDMEISLMNFDAETHHSKLYISLKGKQYELFLHKRLGWRTFFGCKHETYTVVIPENQADDSIVQLFGGCRTVPVKVSLSQTHNQKNVRLQSSYFDVDLLGVFQN